MMILQPSSLRKGHITEIDRDEHRRRNLVLSVVIRIDPALCSNQESIHVTVIRRVVGASTACAKSSCIPISCDARWAACLPVHGKRLAEHRPPALAFFPRHPVPDPTPMPADTPPP